MTSSAAISVRVLLFARYAEVLGREAVPIELPAGSTVGDAVAAIRALPGGHRLPARPLVARDLEQVRPETALRPSDELALLPPMSGG